MLTHRAEQAPVAIGANRRAQMIKNAFASSNNTAKTVESTAGF
jgi:hypothetical protein